MFCNRIRFPFLAQPTQTCRGKHAPQDGLPARGGKRVSQSAWGLALPLLAFASLVGGVSRPALLLGEETPSRLPPPIPFAHAHNDYEHARPLEDALSHGFVSVEADIWLVDGALLVAHEREDVKPERTLESLYLDPLQARVKQGSGKVIDQTEPFYLMIDFKSDGPQTLAALQPVLAKYSEMLTHFKGDKTERRAVTIVLSGDRPAPNWWEQPERLFALDGRPEDLERNTLGPAYIPWISDNYFNHFAWLGYGDCPAKESEKRKQFTQAAHAQGRIVRFWAAPGTEELWSNFRTTGVDLLNADDLARFEEWARKFSAESNR